MHHTPARRSVPASVSSSAGASANTNRRLAVARLGRLLLVDEQAPALHQVHDERDRLELQLQVLAAAPDALQRKAVGHVGPRHGGLQRGEGERSGT